MDVTRVLENLNKRGYTTRYFETGTEAAAYLTARFTNKTIGFGGSMTLKTLGLYESLSERNTVYWHWIQHDKETRDNETRAAVYLTSANGLAETGEIVNIDGAGNRVASTLYGHETVVFVIGINKLAPDLNGAMDRAQNIASPLNARRLGVKTPCATGSELRCYDCKSKERICRGVVTLLRPMYGVGETEVVLVGEELGY